MQIDESALSRAIGTKLKERREDQELSQARLAQLVGLKRTSITNIEAGRQKLSVLSLYQLCAALGCDLGDVLPDVQSVLTPVREEVTINEVRTSVLPRTAEFMRSLVEEREENPQ